MDWGISSVRKQTTRKRIPLQRYWTTRYFITLIIGLLIVTIVSAWWIRHTTLEDRVHMMEIMAEEIANQVVSGQPNDEQALSDLEIRAFLTDPGKYMNMKSNPSIFITNVEGDLLYQNKQANANSFQLNPTILMQKEDVKEIEVAGTSNLVYLVKKPVTVNNTLLGWVVLLEWKENLSEVNQEYKQLLIVIAALAIFGWLAIYILSKRLAKPITEMAQAAEQIKEGNYQITLKEEDVQELEVYELIHAFKEMSQRLEQLETLRTELLAGVTHELKTPVTSISGLIQAVNDDVVEGEEAKEFLHISLQEAEKMEKMVDDLLAFNAFAANTIPLSVEKRSINEVISNCVQQWLVTQENNGLEVKVNELQEDVELQIDHIRIEQIIVNLLNNARDAQQQDGNISLIMRESDKIIHIDVADEGNGIPETEQPFIFERFYRGKAKQTQTSGFGLGLAFSKMIAQAHGGDLQLIKSTTVGTTFQLTLPK